MNMHIISVMGLICLRSLLINAQKPPEQMFRGLLGINQQGEREDAISNEKSDVVLVIERHRLLLSAL